jgi:hypothetical protein
VHLDSICNSDRSISTALGQPFDQISMVVDRCCSRPSSHLAQVRAPIGSAWAATDVIKISEIVTDSGVSLATKYLALFRSGVRLIRMPAERHHFIIHVESIGD